MLCTPIPGFRPEALNGSGQSRSRAESAGYILPAAHAVASIKEIILKTAFAADERGLKQMNQAMDALKPFTLLPFWRIQAAH